jgi:hypothetical protein
MFLSELMKEGIDKPRYYAFVGFLYKGIQSNPHAERLARTRLPKLPEF